MWNIKYKLTFNLPNFRDRILQGAGTRGAVGTTLQESLPNIKGSFISNVGYSLQGASGAFSAGTLANVNSFAGASTNKVKQTYLLDASRSSSTYQDNAKVQQDALLSNMIIKY